MDEKQRAYWESFWSSQEGQSVIEILSGYDKIEREWEKNRRRTNGVIREMQVFNNLLQECLKHVQPVFILNLPDEFLLKLADYGSIGEILLCLKIEEETRQHLKVRLGKDGIALLCSRLIEGI